VIDVWCGLEQSTINMAIDHCHRRLRACIRSKGGQLEHNLRTDDINLVTSFIQKVCLQRRQLGLHPCLFYNVMQWQNYGVVADFILRLGADNCSQNRTAITKVKLQQMLQGHSFLDSQFRVHDAMSAFTR